MARSPCVDAKTLGIPFGSRPDISVARAATSSATATVSGARRRSAGGSNAGAGRVCGLAGAAASPLRMLRAASQPGRRDAQNPMPSMNIVRSLICRSMQPAVAKEEHAVAAPEPERIAHHVPDGTVAVVEADLRPARGIQLDGVERSRREAVLQREQRDRGFKNPGGAECVTGPAFRRAGASGPGEQIRDEAGFHLVVLLARGAMKVDVVDVGGRQAGARQRILNGLACAKTFRMRRRHVMRIARLPVAEKTRPRAVFLEQREAGGLAETDALARRIERPARFGRNELQRV